ncbi:MAG: single-stranded-DNA-specific exonuclease RecJ [Crocinitomicaceae bacterium]
MHKRWIFKEEPDPQVLSQLTTDLNGDEIIARLLLNRGVQNFEEAKNYFNPKLEDLHDPLLMKDMKEAVHRLDQAIDNEEKILIYGDYDVDGTTSVALVYSFLSQVYEHLDFYIPDRYLEGYGISFQGIDFAKENGITLIIALDCGIRAIDKVAYAKEKGIDFIICDHHTPGDQIPEAIVLNPKRKDCEYPYKHLSGCGVGFKFMQAFCEHNLMDESLLFQFLDLLCISIAADIVPITGENRILAHFGLGHLNEYRRAGIFQLLRTGSKENQKLNIEDIVFTIAPRINAAGRISSGKEAVELLTTEDEQFAYEMAVQIDAYNQERREIEKDITAEAILKLEEDDHKFTNVVADEQWHKGVVGIVASKIIERYRYRPTIVFAQVEDVFVGSARSVSDYSVYDALLQCDDLIEKWGGHNAAAGLSVKKENFSAFRQRFEEVVQATISEDQLVPEIEIEMNLNFGDLLSGMDKEGRTKLMRIIGRMEPFGPNNMKPIFRSTNVMDCGSRLVGDDQNHLKLDLFQEGDMANRMGGIGFFMGEDYLKKIQNGPAEIVYTLEENPWNGKIYPQLNVKDIK